MCQPQRAYLLLIHRRADEPERSQADGFQRAVARIDSEGVAHDGVGRASGRGITRALPTATLGFCLVSLFLSLMLLEGIAAISIDHQLLVHRDRMPVYVEDWVDVRGWLAKGTWPRHGVCVLLQSCFFLGGLRF